MTELEKMVKGLGYNGLVPELQELQLKQMLLLEKFNATSLGDPMRDEILHELIPGASKTVYFRGPLYVDYGCFITIGERFYANFNCTILDCCPVTIGNNVLFGPNVSLLTPEHPLDYRDRYPTPGSDFEFARPIVIEDDVWLGGNVVVRGGVRIGKGSVIGAGSVVTKDIPAGVIAFGNPCKVYRKIEEKDRVKNHPELWE